MPETNTSTIAARKNRIAKSGKILMLSKKLCLNLWPREEAESKRSQVVPNLKPNAQASKKAGISKIECGTTDVKKTRIPAYPEMFFVSVKKANKKPKIKKFNPIVNRGTIPKTKPKNKAMALAVKLFLKIK